MNCTIISIVEERRSLDDNVYSYPPQAHEALPEGCRWTTPTEPVNEGLLEQATIPTLTVAQEPAQNS